MIGAIAGDMIGAPWEAAGEKRHAFPLFTEFSRFTDDTVMSVAIGAAILEGRDYGDCMREFGRRHPLAGYGRHFSDWLSDPSMGPYGSYGNGGAMRASPIGFAAGSAREAIEEARRSALPTHGHPEGIRGAQAVALAVYLARSGAAKRDLAAEISCRFGYDLGRDLAEIRAGYSYDLAAERSVPESIICFLEARDYEDAVRNAVSLGGDADTMACIAGAIAEAFWAGVPPSIAAEARTRLAPDLLEVVDRFEARFGITPGDA